MRHHLTRRSTFGLLALAACPTAGTAQSATLRVLSGDARRFLDTLKSAEVRAGLAKAGFMGEKS